MKEEANRDGDSAEFHEVFAAIQSGDQNRKAEFLESFREYLRSIASRAISKEFRMRMSSSDFVQDALIQAQNGLADCNARTQAEFKAWLRTIIMNDILNAYRDLRRQKRDVRREQPVDSGLQLPDQNEKSPSSNVRQFEDEQRLMAAMKKLKPEHQEIIKLRHKENMTFVEIARQTNRTPDSARMLWNRAIDQLSKALKPPQD